MSRRRHNFDFGSQRRKYRAAKRRGFTLIELVIALALAAALAVSLAATMHVAFQATDSASNDIEPGRTADLSLAIAGDDLRNALQSSGQLVGSFEGTQSQDNRGHETDDVVFYSTTESPQHVDANGEVKQVELKVVQAANGDHLLVRRVVRNLLAQTLPTPDEEIICRGVSSFSLQYFDGSNWDMTWDSTVEDNTIPAAVRIDLQLERPDRSGKNRILEFTRTVNLSCSTAANDPTVNIGESLIQ